MAALIINGRSVDNTCPHSGDCWANSGCISECPPTAYDVLRLSAALEHDLDLLPHNDPDLTAVCQHADCTSTRKA
jgi:hypothetical protein